MDRDWDKGICLINSCIPCSKRCVNLLNKDTTSGTVAAVRVTLELAIVNCHSPSPTCLLNGTDKGVKMRCRNHLPYNFQVLDGGTNFCNSSWYSILFWVHHFSGRQFQRLSFGLSNHNSSYSTGQGTNGEFCQRLSIPIMQCRTEEITTDCVLKPTEPTVSWTLAKTPLITWPP